MRGKSGTTTPAPVRGEVVSLDLLAFMERTAARYELKGDKARADKLRKIIREWKDREQTALSL
jgi:hypothetical protein